METNPTPVYYTKSKDDDFFRKRHTTTVCFVIGLLLFLLPFAELRCGSVTLMSNSGIGIAIGSEWKVAMGGNKYMNRLNSDVKENKAKDALSSGLNIFLLVAIAAVIFGLCSGFFDQKWKHIAVMCAALLSCVMLIAVMIQLNILMRSSLDNGMKDKPDLTENMGNLIKIRFTIWYYMSLISFGCAAFFAYRHYKLILQDELEKSTDFDFQKKQV